MFEHAGAAFAAAGLARYEVSSYARPGRSARHNRLYWSLAAYLGAGASASSFRPLADGTAWRFANPRATDVYLRKPRRGSRATSSGARPPIWRTKPCGWGYALSPASTAPGIAPVIGVDPVSRREAAVAAAVKSGWLVVDDVKLQLTADGFLFADEVATRLWL